MAAFTQTLEKSSSILMYDIVPTVAPCQYCSEFAFVEADNKIYRWDGSAWIEYLPSNGGIISADSVVLSDNDGNFINDTLENAISNIFQRIVAMQNALGIPDFASAFGTFNGSLFPDNQTATALFQIIETELENDLDGSISNEGSLTVSAGGANDADIFSNTNNSTRVKLVGGNNVTITENPAQNEITITAAGGGGTADGVSVAGTYDAVNENIDVTVSGAADWSVDLSAVAKDTDIPTAVSELTNDSGYVTTSNDADSDPANEIQTLSISGQDLTLSDGGGTVTLPGSSGGVSGSGSSGRVTYWDTNSTISSHDRIRVTDTSYQVFLPFSATDEVFRAGDANHGFGLSSYYNGFTNWGLRIGEGVGHAYAGNPNFANFNLYRSRLGLNTDEPETTLHIHQGGAQANTLGIRLSYNPSNYTVINTTPSGAINIDPTGDFMAFGGEIEINRNTSAGTPVRMLTLDAAGLGQSALYHYYEDFGNYGMQIGGTASFSATNNDAFTFRILNASTRLGINQRAPDYSIHINTSEAAIKLNPHNSTLVGTEGVLYANNSANRPSYHDGTDFRTLAYQDEIPSGGGTMSSFTVTGDTGTTLIEDSETLSIAGSITKQGIDAAVTDNTLTLELDLAEIAVQPTASGTFFVTGYDTGDQTNRLMDIDVLTQYVEDNSFPLDVQSGYLLQTQVTGFGVASGASNLAPPATTEGIIRYDTTIDELVVSNNDEYEVVQTSRHIDELYDQAHMDGVSLSLVTIARHQTVTMLRESGDNANNTLTIPQGAAAYANNEITIIGRDLATGASNIVNFSGTAAQDGGATVTSITLGNFETITVRCVPYTSANSYRWVITNRY